MAVVYPPSIKRDTVNGKKVVKDEVCPSNLSKYHGRLIPLHGLRVLTLEDGEQVFGCDDCLDVGTRGEVVAHRNKAHGLTDPHRRSPVAGTDPETATRMPYPQGVHMSMTILGLLELAEHVGDWEGVLTNLEQENARLREQVAEKTRQLRDEQRDHEKLKKKVAGQLKRQIEQLTGGAGDGDS